jgi:uncharacterized iron-regulated membrane protein
MKIFFRKLHRWLGLLMAIQIIAWMASGLYFSIFPISEIRGEHLTRAVEKPASGQFAGLSSPAEVLITLNDHFTGDWELSSAKLIRIDGQTVWRISGSAGGEPFARLIRPDGNGVIPRLSAEEAERRAVAWLRDPLEVIETELLESTSNGAEFRGRPLPVWKVSFESPDALTLYLDPWTGELLARRTDRWRIFDFFWMLHVMDYDTRDDFNHPLLQFSSLMGLIIALSGVIFWAMTTRLFRRRKLVVNGPNQGN